MMLAEKAIDPIVSKPNDMHVSKCRSSPEHCFQFIRSLNVILMRGAAACIVVLLIG